MATPDELTARLTEIVLGFLPRLYQERVMDYCTANSLNVKQQVTMALRLVELWEIQIFTLDDLDAMLPMPALVTLTEEQEYALDDMVSVLVDVDKAGG